MSQRIWLFILPILAFVAGCQTLSEEECAAADWRVIGEQDGTEGVNPQDRFGAHVKACERAGIIPDQTLWYEGYQSGLMRYCTPLNGLAAGRAGGSYNNVCPAETATAFLRGYQLGKNQFDLESEIRSRQSEINAGKARLDKLEAKLDVAEPEDRRKFRRRIREKKDEIASIRRERDRLEDDLIRVKRDIDYFQSDPNIRQPSPAL